MQRVVPYVVENELYSLDFLEDRSLPILVICPNPQLSDLLTSSLPALPTLQCMTISKFVSDKLSVGFPEVTVFRKADFLLHLGTIHKKYFPDSPVESFFQAFTLFTELRSFTLEWQLIREVLSQFGEDISRAIEIFWHYSDHIDLVDEHRAYQLLSEAFREMNHPIHQEWHYKIPAQNIIFWGFGHLSAGQVDLLKSISIYNDVYVPFPQAVLGASKMSDWIRWIDPALKVSPVETKLGKLKICSFAKNRLSETLASWLKTRELPPDFYLATQRPTFHELAEVPLHQVHYRSASGIFMEAYKAIASQLENHIGPQHGIELLLPWVEEQKRLAASHQQYREIKVWQLFKQQLIEWQELSESNQNISPFDFSLIAHVVELNLPRVFVRPLVKESDAPQIGGLESLPFFRSAKGGCVCVTSNYTPLKGGRDKYPLEVMQLLSTLGPMRRPEFDFEMIKAQLLHVLSSSDATLFLEQGILERDLAWEEIAQKAESIEWVQLPGRDFVRAADLLSLNLKTPIEGISRSATALQSYLDCPRKYYYDYVAKAHLFTAPQGEMSAALLGQLEHKVIEEYFIKNRSYDEMALAQIVSAVFSAHENLNITPLKLAQYRQEVLAYARNGIILLGKILNLHPKAKIFFERPLLNHKNGRGRVDCLILDGDKTMLFDFKRSAASIPAQRELQDFEKIQLWFYFNHLALTEEQLTLFGYINLSSSAESLLLASNSDNQAFYQAADLLEGGKISLFKVDLKERIETYQHFEDNLVNRMMQDLHFHSAPRKDAVCAFCTMAAICPRINYGTDS